MQRQLAGLQNVLDVPFIRRVRRNHGLEHATIHMLSRRVPGLRLVGRSDAGGFWLYGEVSTEDVESSATMALNRMRAGEHQLAIHPNCGTNILTVALIGSVAALLVLVGSERERFGRLQRLPLLALALVMAIIFGQPLGLQLQQYITTLGDPADLEIVDVRQGTNLGLTVHRVRTHSS